MRQRYVARCLGGADMKHTVILYQAADSAVIAWIAMGIYIKAQMLGEKVGGPKPARGRQAGQV